MNNICEKCMNKLADNICYLDKHPDFGPFTVMGKLMIPPCKFRDITKDIEKQQSYADFLLENLAIDENTKKQYREQMGFDNFELVENWWDEDITGQNCGLMLDSVAKAKDIKSIILILKGDKNE